MWIVFVHVYLFIAHSAVLRSPLTQKGVGFPLISPTSPPEKPNIISVLNLFVVKLHWFSTSGNHWKRSMPHDGHLGVGTSTPHRLRGGNWSEMSTPDNVRRTEGTLHRKLALFFKIRHTSFLLSLTQELWLWRWFQRWYWNSQKKPQMFVITPLSAVH